MTGFYHDERIADVCLKLPMLLRRQRSYDCKFCISLHVGASLLLVTWGSSDLLTIVLSTVCPIAVTNPSLPLNTARDAQRDFLAMIP